MTDRHDPRRRHGDDPPDERLAALLAEAADAVEPGEGLTAIRTRTRRPSTRPTKETTVSSNRTWLYAVAGAAVGTAAVIVAIAVVGGLDDDSSVPTASSSPSDPGTGQTEATSAPPSTSPTDTPTPSDPTGTPVEGVVPVYFAGDGPRGTVLFREFQPGIGGDPVAQAASAAVSGTPSDPDYRTLWPAGTEATASYADGVVTVDLSGDGLQARPGGLSKRDAGLALQQVVYSVQGVVQDRAPVRFLVGGQPSDAVLGAATDQPVTNAPLLKTLSLMSITAPTEGQTVADVFEATGANNGFEASVAWEVRDAGGQVVANGSGTAAGAYENKLFPWKVTVDLSALTPGTYTFVAMNDDPSGEGAGGGPDTDTRTIVVE